MANLQNLIPINEINKKKTSEERRRNASEAGKKSGEAKRQKKAIKETINLLLSMPVYNEKTKKQMKELGYEDDDLTNQTALVLAMYKKALSGDVNAFNTIADRSGETITQKIEKTEIPKIIDDIK